jgi:molybdopterin synthase catalytic subunit
MSNELMDFPTVIEIVETDLDLNGLIARIISPSTGAIGIFTGIVRGITTRVEPIQTEYLEYEAYRPMAEIKMTQIAAEIRAQWSSIEGIAIVQRIGRVFPGTPTTIVACSATHRDQGVFDAAQYGIDRLKEIVPIWKKEVGLASEVWVEGDYLPNSGE